MGMKTPRGSGLISPYGTAPPTARSGAIRAQAALRGEGSIPVRGAASLVNAAKGKGIYKGRQKKVDGAEIQRLAAAGISKAQIARDLGVSRMTVYRALDTGNTKADVDAD